jgi:FK506-binding protein 3
LNYKFHVLFLISGSKKRGGTYVPLKFKVGTGQVIRGWDEALMTMGLDEKAELTIHPEWAYGRKGLPDHKYPKICVLDESKIVFHCTE